LGRKNMALKRMDNVLLVVDDLEAVKAFFLELGLELEGETPTAYRGGRPEGAQNSVSRALKRTADALPTVGGKITGGAVSQHWWQRGPAA
jgi:catechol 2,3-dioxygenase-like lactoylglutathione lyase family enzyme